MDYFSSDNYSRGNNLNRFLAKTYGLMCLAVFISAVTASLVMNVYADQFSAFISNSRWGIWLIILLPIALTFIISFDATRNPLLSLVLLAITAIVYGITFSFIAEAYTDADIATAFISAAGVFLTMSLIGTFSSRDFTRLGAYASAALIGLVIAMIINWFFRNPAVDYLLSFIAVGIFTALTAWDARQMKNIFFRYGSSQQVAGLAIVGALQLYLDFVNLFANFLTIFSFGDDR